MYKKTAGELLLSTLLLSTLEHIHRVATQILPLRSNLGIPAAPV
jgi:hypothetical protein